MVDPEKIRRDLQDVWVGLGSESEDEGGVLRACALTLIAVTDDNGNPSALAETLAALMPEHPSRAIVIRLAPGQENVLEAEVEAQCWMPFGQRQQICSEQIVVRCTEKTLDEVPSVILPLVAPDLPVVLWCPSERAWKAGAFSGLAEPSTRILLDTSRASRPAEALLALAAESKRAGAVVMDLSWTRLTRWRALLAQAFENELCRQMPGLTELAITYQGSSPIPATAILMAGWIASRLGWPPADTRRWGFAPRDAGLEPGKLAALELKRPAKPLTSIAITRLAGSWAEVRVAAGSGEVLTSRVALAPSTDVLLLSEELGIHAPDRIFEESLAAASQIAEALVRR